MIINADTENFHFVANLADVRNVIDEATGQFANVAKSVAARKDFDKRTEFLGAADDSIVDLADLDSRCASFDLLQSDFGQFAVVP